jgi:hypothetical protein
LNSNLRCRLTRPDSCLVLEPIIENIGARQRIAPE